MRDKLIELIRIASHELTSRCVGDCGDCADKIADHILADGWIRPPCKVGDRVYMVVNDKRVKKPYECNVVGFWYTNHEDYCTLHLTRYVNGKIDSSFSVRFTDIGKTVFLNREDAKRALKGDVGK